jgi:hypothetical protein
MPTFASVAAAQGATPPPPPAGRGPALEDAAEKLKQAAEALQKGERERRSDRPGGIGAQAQLSGALYALTGGAAVSSFRSFERLGAAADPFSTAPTLSASVKGVAIEIGSGFLPALRDASAALQMFERFLSRVPAPVKTAAGDASFGAAALGPPGLFMGALWGLGRKLFGGGKPELEDFKGPSARIFQDPGQFMDAVQVAALNTGDKSADNLKKQLENAEKMQQTVENIGAQIDRLLDNTSPRHR